MNTYKYMHMNTHAHIQIHVWTHIQIHTRAHRNIHTHEHMRTYRRTQRNTYTSTHTHVSFIHLSWNKHLGCSYFLATVKKMSQWAKQRRCVLETPMSCPLDTCPEVGSFWILWGALVLFSVVAIVLYISSSIFQRSLVHTRQHLSP